MGCDVQCIRKERLLASGAGFRIPARASGYYAKKIGFVWVRFLVISR